MDLSSLAAGIQALQVAATVATETNTYAPIDHGLSTLGKGMAFGLAAFGGAIGIGLVFASAIMGIARQPEQTATLRTMAFLGFAFIEALALIGFVLTFILN